MAADFSTATSPATEDTKEFLSLVSSTFGWRDLSDEIIMDVGCGAGTNSTRLIVKQFPNIRKVIGIDLLPSFIHAAKMGNTFQQIDYYVANIEDRCNLIKCGWDGKMTKVVSIFCFNWLLDQETGFRNIYHLLKSGGEAAILFTINSPYYKCLKHLLDHPKWKDILKNMESLFPESRNQKLIFSQYKEVLEEIGFSVVLCEMKEKIFEYPSEESFTSFTIPKCPLFSYIPEKLKEDFKEEYFSVFAEMNGKTFDGRPRIRYQIVTILVKKNS